MAVFSYHINRRLSVDSRISSYRLPTGSAMAKIRQLESYYFHFNDHARTIGFDPDAEGSGAPAPRRIGMIAQALEQVEPTLVKPIEVAQDESGTQYYGIDYQTLNAMCIDALNELNERADAIKTQLGMPIETYPEIHTYIPEQMPQYEITSITCNPQNGVEGSVATWTVTGTNLPDGLPIPFKLRGTFNHLDISLNEDIEHVNTTTLNIHDPSFMTEEDIFHNGMAWGWLVAKDGEASITLNYIKDNTIEGTEEIRMELGEKDGWLKPINTSITATATISDS